MADPLSMHATTHRKSFNLCPFVIVGWDVNVCPLTVALVIRADAFGSVAIDNASDENSCLILPHATASQEIAA